MVRKPKGMEDRDSRGESTASGARLRGQGFASFGCRPACARHVRARAEIIMLGEAGCAEMKLVDLAMNHRPIGPAQFTTDASPPAGVLSFRRRHSGCDSCFYRSGFQINAGSS